MNTDNFNSFGLTEPMLRALNGAGYTQPTAVQAAAMRPQLEGSDLLALAETGSGKTAAFLVPILNQLVVQKIRPVARMPVALILAPTRELAVQIDKEVAKLSKSMHLHHAVILGGVGKGKQISALRRGVHILVATPGRLLDLVADGHIDLANVQFFVLDEADRMFDMGFIRDIRKISGLIPNGRRTAMFSATMPREVRKLANDLLQKPVSVDLSRKELVVDRIDQTVLYVSASDKQNQLRKLLDDPAFNRVIVFTRTKRGADRVTEKLERSQVSAAAIHGNKAQNARQRALSQFSNGKVRVLVATDIAARGIDVSDVSHVINFDLPMEPETYIHRIGRTARKGQHGSAISICDPSERRDLAVIERMMGLKIPRYGNGTEETDVELKSDAGDIRSSDGRDRQRKGRPSNGAHRSHRPNGEKSEATGQKRQEAKAEAPEKRTDRVKKSKGKNGRPRWAGAKPDRDQNSGSRPDARGRSGSSRPKRRSRPIAASAERGEATVLLS